MHLCFVGSNPAVVTFPTRAVFKFSINIINVRSRNSFIEVMFRVRFAVQNTAEHSLIKNGPILEKKQLASCALRTL